MKDAEFAGSAAVGEVGREFPLSVIPGGVLHKLAVDFGL